MPTLEEQVDYYLGGSGVLEEGTLSPMAGDESVDVSSKITLPANVRNRVSRRLEKIGNYHNTLASIVEKIKEALSPEVQMVVNGNIWDGAFSGSLGTEQTYRDTVRLYYAGKLVSNSALVLNIYKMPRSARSKYELNTYLS